MMGASGLECEILFYELVTKPTVTRIRKITEGAPKEQLERIVQEYESSPWYKKIDRKICFHAYRNFETNLTYVFARDLLNGTFSWEQVDEEQKKTDRERERLIQESKQREEMIRCGKSTNLFMGSLEEYERLRGQPYKIIDTGNPIYYHPRDSRIHLFLGKLGVEALIRFKQEKYTRGGIGISIRKK